MELSQVAPHRAVHPSAVWVTRAGGWAGRAPGLPRAVVRSASCGLWAGLGTRPPCCPAAALGGAAAHAGWLLGKGHGGACPASGPEWGDGLRTKRSTLRWQVPPSELCPACCPWRWLASALRLGDAHLLSTCCGGPAAVPAPWRTVGILSLPELVVGGWSLPQAFGGPRMHPGGI